MSFVSLSTYPDEGEVIWDRSGGGDGGWLTASSFLQRFRLPGEAQAVAGATIIVPLGTLLTEELKIAVDGGKAKSYSYRFCSLVGCYAQIGLTDADIAAFKAGAAATLQIVPAQAPDQKVDIKVSLSGFTAAFDNTTVLEE